MDIFQLIDKNSPDTCFLNDEIFLDEDTFFKPKSFIIDIASFKELYGEECKIRIPYAGKLIFRAGALIEGKSWIWLFERSLNSGAPEIAEIIIPLNELDRGRLELEIYAVEDSILYDVSSLAQKADFEPARQLYSFSGPSFDLCHEVPLYYHFYDSKSWHSFEDNYVYIKKGGSCDLLTYFNSFSCEKWHKHTNVDQLSLYVDFKGNALAELVAQTPKGVIPLSAWRLDSPVKERFELPLDKMPHFGLLGLRLYALADSVLYGGGYFTSAPEKREVRLGIGITSYRRENAVRGAIVRLKGKIDKHPFYKDKIQITVVDNGQTLKPDDVIGARLIPNRNLGGSGGFMRNLIHYKEGGDVTYCLFMDDDAACDATSIFRSLSFLRHAEDEHTAISGAMLSENIKFIQWENGAWFDGGCHPLKCEYDLRNPETLLRNEEEINDKEIYGAWWFFMFPIKYVRQYSFPFFVRGDDIEFSYLNEFKVRSLNGVGVWQEDFKTKEGPQTLYFDIRSHVLHHMILPHINQDKWRIIKMVARFFNRFNDSYQYDTAKSILMSFNDLQQGPEYWLQNMDASAIRQKVSDILTDERQNPLTLNVGNIKKPDKKKREKPEKPDKLKQALKKVSLNGHLLPEFALTNRQEVISAYEMPDAERIFLKNKVLVYNQNTGKQWLLRKNSRYYFKNKAGLYMAFLKFILRYSKLRNQYKEFFKTLENDSFWKNEFGKVK